MRRPGVPGRAFEPVAVWEGPVARLLTGDDEFEERLRWTYWYEHRGVVLPYAGITGGADEFLAWARGQEWAWFVEDSWIGAEDAFTVRWIDGEELEDFLAFIARAFSGTG